MTGLRALGGFPGSSPFPGVGRLWFLRLGARLLDGLALLLIRVMIAVAEQAYHRRVVGPLESLVELPIVGRCLVPVRSGVHRDHRGALPPVAILETNVRVHERKLHRDRESR